MTRRLAAALALAAGVFSGNAPAHDAGGQAAAASLVTGNRAVSVAADDFPVTFGGGFELVDHFGDSRSSADYRGEHLLVFFGYSSCPFMCPQTLRSIGAALHTLGEKAARVNAVMITVDPENDTPQRLRAKMPQIHPQMVGLTGSPAQLEKAYRAFRVEPKAVEAEWNGTAVISHASYIYLLGPDGRFRTLMPPILPPETMAKIIGRYLEAPVEAEASAVEETSG